MTQMGLNYLVHQETLRSNMANENLKKEQNVETARHNVRTESVAFGELEVKRGTLDETIRSNVAREKETNRSNIAREAETYRSNIARERETHRSNTANESIALETLGENRRANKAREFENQRSNIAKENENYRSNTAREKETSRANTLNSLTPTMASQVAFQTGVEQNLGNIATHGISTGLDTLTSMLKWAKLK